MPYPVHGEVDAQRVVQLVEEFDETLFLRRKPRGQVNGGRKRGPPPSPLRLPLCPSPLCPVLPPCLPSCLHPCLPSLLPPPPRCAWALGCPRSSPCSPVTGARWQHSVAPGHAWPLQSGDPSVQDREAGKCIPSAPAVLEGDGGTPALPTRVPPSLGLRQEHGGGCSIAPPGAQRREQSLRRAQDKRAWGEQLCWGCVFPALGLSCFRTKQGCWRRSVVGQSRGWVL